jgi:hypothetical protein
MDHQFVEAEKIDPLLICSICQCPFQKCYEHPCQITPHRFCKDCISSWLSRSSSCPICRGPMQINKLIPVSLGDQLVSQLKIYCPHKTSGCYEILQIHNLEDHLKRFCKVSVFLQKMKEEEAKQKQILLEIEKNKQEEKRKLELIKQQQENKRLEMERLEMVKRQQEIVLRIQREREEEKQREEALRLEKQMFTGPSEASFCVENSEFISENLRSNTFSCALFDCGFVGLTKSGFWGTGIPTELYNKLNGRKKSLSPPMYIAGGSNDRYYLEFKDGSAVWSASDNFSKVIKSVCQRVKFVTFGTEYDSYFIMWKDGRTASNNLPTKLNNKIKSRNPKLPPLHYVSLGPNNQWFVQWENGKMEWYDPQNEPVYFDSEEVNACDLFSRYICSLPNVKSVFFARNQYLIRYN